MTASSDGAAPDVPTEQDGARTPQRLAALLEQAWVRSDDHEHVPAWVTDPADRAYLSICWQRWDELNRERAKVMHRINKRVAMIAARGGHALMLELELASTGMGGPNPMTPEE